MNSHSARRGDENGGRLRGFRALTFPLLPNQMGSQAGCGCGWNLATALSLSGRIVGEPKPTPRYHNSCTEGGKMPVDSKLNICIVGSPLRISSFGDPAIPRRDEAAKSRAAMVSIKVPRVVAPLQVWCSGCGCDPLKYLYIIFYIDQCRDQPLVSTTHNNREGIIPSDGVASSDYRFCELVPASLEWGFSVRRGVGTGEG